MAEDFRTWHATVLATVAVTRSHPGPRGRGAVRAAIAAAAREVSEFLGNTPAACRASYIDPRVFDRLGEGITIAPVLAEPHGDPMEDQRACERIEQAVLDLLAGELDVLERAA